MEEVIIIVCMIVAAIVILGFLGGMIYGLIEIRHCTIVGSNHIRIMDAIHKYRMDMHRRNIEPEVEYDDMEPIQVSNKRFWDWGYKRILPPDKFKIIEKYIEE